MPRPLGLMPGKIVAVHLNYRSRAAQRGRTPAYPSYFFKPASALIGTDDVVERPPHCRLLGVEGEIALVIGTPARRVSKDEAWSYVGWVTAANDIGAYDMRYADSGSNVRSKGADGFLPIGPALLDAAAVDPTALRVRMWINGSSAQDAGGEELIFDLADIVSDLSQWMTLEAGDIILAGTPAGATVAEPGDLVEVEVSCGDLSTGRLASTIVDSPATLSRFGAQPRWSEEEQAAALGERIEEPAAPTLDEETAALLRTVSVATLSATLGRRGLQTVLIEGLQPTRPDLRMVGTAHTLQYLPLREDLFAERGGGFNPQKRSIEEIQPGQVLVIGARGEAEAGTMGDILALRALKRGAVGIVTDGGLRDARLFADLDLPTYYQVPHPAVLGRRHVPWASGLPIACGNVLVQPGDVIVGDGEGVIVIPPAIVAEVAKEAAEQERQERFISEQVMAGASVDGLYPIGPRWREAYDAWTDPTEGPTETPTDADAANTVGSTTTSTGGPA